MTSSPRSLWARPMTWTARSAGTRSLCRLAARSPAERAQKLLAAADILSGSAEDLAPLLVREHGGVMWEAQTDFALGTGVLQHTASLIEDFSRPV